MALAQKDRLINDKTATITRLKSQLSELKVQFTSTGVELANTKHKLKNNDAQFDQLRKTMDNQNNTITSLMQDNVKLAAENTNLKNKLAAQNAELTKLRELNERNGMLILLLSKEEVNRMVNFGEFVAKKLGAPSSACRGRAHNRVESCESYTSHSRGNADQSNDEEKKYSD